MFGRELDTLVLHEGCHVWCKDWGVRERVGILVRERAVEGKGEGVERTIIYNNLCETCGDSGQI